MKKNKKRNSLSYSTSEVVIPAIILLIFVVIIFIIIVNFIFKAMDKPEEIDYDAMIWEQAYLEAQSKKVGIVFDPISTMPEEYTQLQARCQEYIDNTNDTSDIDAEIEVDTIINEELYIDNTPPEKVSLSEIEDSSLEETGPIYFDNMLMMRYINSEGHMKVISAIYNKNKTKISIARQDELTTKYSMSQLKTEDRTGITNSNVTYETDYLKEIGVVLVDMLEANTTNDIIKADEGAIKYFTLDGKKSVYGGKSKLSLNGQKVKCNYIIAGNSSTSKTYKDRIYVQLISYEEDKSTENIYMILKLNTNLRIFDIDLL